MSLIERAKIELAKWDEDDRRVMIEILEKFFDQWDSGGAVHFAAPVLQRLIAGKPLSPLTGADDEWYQPMPDHPTLQNKRCSSVFKDADGRVHDIDGDPAVTFPYWPRRAEVPSPLVEITVKE